MTELVLKGDARLSPCRNAAIASGTTWDETKPPLVDEIRNPSVASQQDDDAQIRRCIRRAD